MNERQKLAYRNPCYTPDDLKRNIFEERVPLGRLMLRTQLKVMGFFANELWMATVFACDNDGFSLGKKDLSGQELAEIQTLLGLLLKGVGKDKINYFENESEFEAARFLSRREVENLPKINLDELFDIKQRQEYALRDACPSIDAMLMRKFTRIVDCGGFLFSTILTVKNSPEGFAWHSSSCVLDEHKNPLPIFETPFGAGTVNLEIAVRLLHGVGSGQVSTYRPDNETCIISMFRKLSEKEEKSLSLVRKFQPAEILSPFLKKDYN